MEQDAEVGSCWEGHEPDYLLNLPCARLRARDLLGLVCLHGGGQPPTMPPDLPALYEQVCAHPDTLLALTAAFDARGGPYQFPREDNASQRRADLHVLERLQLAPGDARSARELFRRLKAALPDLDGVCVFADPTENWPSWPAEAAEAYRAGLERPLPQPCTPEQRAETKRASAAEIITADRLYLRPPPPHLHHVLLRRGRRGADRGRQPLGAAGEDPRAPRH